LSPCEGHFSLYGKYFAKPSGENVQEWVPKAMSKFHNDPAVEEFGIVVLLRHVLDLYGKRESYDAKDISITSNKFSKIPTVRMFGNEFQT